MLLAAAFVLAGPPNPAVPVATPPHHHSTAGEATWYGTGIPGHAAAGPALRQALGASWRGRAVSINGIRLLLTDWCACGGKHLIDLSPRDFRAVCGSLSRGVCHVSVRW